MDALNANQSANSAHVSLRTVTALEVASVIISVLITAWLIVPLLPFNRWLLPLPALLALALMIYSHRLRGESLRDLGFTTRHFGRALLLLAIPMLIGAAVLAAIGYFAGALHSKDRSWAILIFLPLWGLMQQYTLQAFIYRRLRFILVPAQLSPNETASRVRLAIFSAAALFALVHAPNLPLMALSLIAGLIWSWVYERAPNLFALALSHCLMSTLALATLPVHSMSIGYQYFLQQRF
jgi:membrane protease YdiL (CAAX protease family)